MNYVTIKKMASFSQYCIQDFKNAMDQSVASKSVRAKLPDGKTFRTKSLRMRLFHSKGVKCVSCGLEANMCSMETSISTLGESPHLNLYFKGDNEYILFTKDHVIPKVYGGPDLIENMDVMCEPCNKGKGHTNLDFEKMREVDVKLRSRYPKHVFNYDLEALNVTVPE